MWKAAVDAAVGVKYDSVGTVEFLYVPTASSTSSR